MSKSELVKQSINILDVLQNDGVIVIANKCACPLHGGKSRTMWVRPDTNSFNCFSCGKGGTIIDYWMYSRGLDAKDAINSLLETYGLSATNDWGHIKQQQTERQKQLDKQKERDEVYRKLCDKMWAIKDWIEANKPKSMDEEWNSALPRAYDKLLHVEYLLDCLMATRHDWNEKEKWFKEDDTKTQEWAFQQAQPLLQKHKSMLDKKEMQSWEYAVDRCVTIIDYVDEQLGGIGADEMSIILSELQPWVVEHVRGAWEARKLI